MYHAVRLTQISLKITASQPADSRQQAAASQPEASQPASQPVCKLLKD